VLIRNVGGFQSITGKGVTGTVEGRRAAIGNARLFEEFGIDVQALLSLAGRRGNVESAAITLDKRELVRARRLSQAMMKNIGQNLFFAFVYRSSIMACRLRRAFYTRCLVCC
jgi:cation transport ATPase